MQVKLFMIAYQYQIFMKLSRMTVNRDT